MKAFTLLKHLAALAFLVMVISCGSAWAQSVNAYLNCGDGYVDPSADAYPGWYFGYGTLEVWTTGPQYNTYNSTSGTGGLWLQAYQSFQYDSYYTVTACAYFEDDNGNRYICDYAYCTTPPAP